MAGLTGGEIYEFQEAFRLFDQDGSGFIALGNFKKVLGCLGVVPTKSEMDAMITRMKLDKSELVNSDQFMDAMSYYKMQHSDMGEDGVNLEDMEELFHMFDKNGDGYITAPELRLTMVQLGERLSDAEVDEMFKAADQDGDGKINYKEFQRMMSQ